MGNFRKLISQKKEFKFLTFACFPLHVINLVSLTYHVHHKFCWKSIHDVSWLRSYFRKNSTRKYSHNNGKKHSHNKVSYNYLGSPTQADHNSRRSQYSHVLTRILFSCFSPGKFEKTLACYLHCIETRSFLYFYF